jgi:hypothetical protein
MVYSQGTLRGGRDLPEIINENNLPIVVTSDADAPGATGTLRAAINLANSQPGVNTIEFAPNLAGPTGQTIILLSDLPAITGDLDIAGPVSIVTQHHQAFQHAPTHNVTEVDFVASDSGPLTPVPSSDIAPIFVNTSALTIFVTVAQQQAVLLTGQINSLVDTGVLNSGNGNALTAKLTNAAASFAAGNPTAGINKVGCLHQPGERLRKLTASPTHGRPGADPHQRRQRHHRVGQATPSRLVRG